MGMEWLNFEEVKVHIPAGRRLFRASAPNYDRTVGDSSQNLTQTAVDFLQSKGITQILSFTKIKYNQAEIDRATAAGISYHHLPVEDFTAATPEQLESAFRLFSETTNSSTLVHCGFGHGRTGTCVTAIQLHTTQGVSPAESTWQTVNHVETDAQVEVLKQIRDSLQARVHEELW